MVSISAEEGAYLVSLARRAMEQYIDNGSRLMPEKNEGVLSEKHGIYMGLHAFPSNEPLGCIGVELPLKPLAGAVVESALLAAADSPGTPQLDRASLSRTVIEISVLSKLERILVKNPEEYPRKIKAGRDGLSITYGYAHSLLLPQVAVDWNLTEREFLCRLCEQAGLPPQMWKSPSAKISRFEAAVFSEKTPGGKVLKRRLIR